MSKSLRDQLLQAGLVSKHEVRDTNKTLHKQTKEVNKKTTKKTKQPVAKPYDLHEAPESRAERIKESKKNRDRELEEKRKANTQIRERNAQIRQLIKSHEVMRKNGEESFQFLMPALGKTIKKIVVDAEQHKKLGNGQLAIIWFQDQFFLVKPEGARKIYERDSQIVYHVDSTTHSLKDDKQDPYSGYEIPDDLMW